MALLFPEPYIDAALDSLKDGLPGAIAAVNADHGDFSIPTPRDPEGYFWGVETALAEFPSIEIGAPEELLDNFSLGQVSADSTPMLAARAWLAMTDEINSRERMARANYRFGRAVNNVLIAPDAFGNHVVIDQLRASWRLNPLTRESEEVRGSTMIVYTLSDVEQYG